MPTQLISESVEILKETIDNEKRTVEQIIIRAGESKNKRHYSVDVIRTAVDLFDDSKTYRNHQTPREMKEGGGRNVSDLTGWLDSPRYDESRKAIVATRHFTANGAGQDAWKVTQQIVEGSAPASLLGGSINALGTGTLNKDSGLLEVDSITRVLSVDDVTTPAAGGGFEKLVASEEGIIGAILAEATYLEFYEARPDYIKRIHKEIKKPRQDKAVKAAQAEANRYKEALEKLQEDTKAINENLITALNDTGKAQNELFIEKMLHKVRLPAEWRESIRQQLIDAKPEKWERIIKEEVQKAKRLNKSSVTGTTRQVQKSIGLESTVDLLLPIDDEDFEAYLERTNKTGQ